ncbi:MAG: hypothetical protein K0V04_31770 [Deltaproteobacteria bacterium]|nr:hypothetical protein [Deltaproteobacteria bacterium]
MSLPLPLPLVPESADEPPELLPLVLMFVVLPGPVLSLELVLPELCPGVVVSSPGHPAINNAAANPIVRHPTIESIRIIEINLPPRKSKSE